MLPERVGVPAYPDQPRTPVQRKKAGRQICRVLLLGGEGGVNGYN